MLNSTTDNKIRYSQCWEDADLVIEALNPGPDDTVLSVTSGGCNTFSMIAAGAGNVISVDINKAQTLLSKLKYSAMQQLPYESYLQFIGIEPSANREQQFDQIKPYLDKETFGYFDKNRKIIKEGIIHTGIFERYLKKFRKYILPLAKSKKAVSRLLLINNKKIQQQHFHTQWNNKRWRLFVKIFFGKTVMQLFGRHKNMFRYNRHENVGIIMLNRIEAAFSHGPVFQNPYLHYALTGNYGNALPHYLRLENFKLLKQANSNVKLVTENIINLLKKQPDHTIDKFNLSDVFESMSEDECNTVMEEILRVAKNGAILIFWNNFVNRDVPVYLKNHFILNKPLIDKLIPIEKVFFYEKFFIYTIQQ